MVCNHLIVQLSINPLLCIDTRADKPKFARLSHKPILQMHNFKWQLFSNAIRGVQRQICLWSIYSRPPFLFVCLVRLNTFNVNDSPVGDPVSKQINIFIRLRTSNNPEAPTSGSVAIGDVKIVRFLILLLKRMTRLHGRSRSWWRR